MTQFPDLFTDLASPFGDREVKALTKGSKQIKYVTARVVMNRLDFVLGPENWWDEYTPLENSVVCRLTIRLPDGQILSKADAGGYAGMSDQGDDDKSGYSDAFKRAAVKFGVGRYLYGDGVPRFEGPDAPADFAQQSPAPEAPARADSPKAAAKPPKDDGTWDQWVARLIKRWAKTSPVEGGEDQRAREQRITNALISESLALKKTKGPAIWQPGQEDVPEDKRVRDMKKTWAEAYRLWAQEHEWARAFSLTYLKEKIDDASPKPSNT
jgi:hypothetical protein